MPDKLKTTDDAKSLDEKLAEKAQELHEARNELETVLKDTDSSDDDKKKARKKVEDLEAEYARLENEGSSKFATKKSARRGALVAGTIGAAALGLVGYNALNKEDVPEPNVDETAITKRVTTNVKKDVNKALDKRFAARDKSLNARFTETNGKIDKGNKALLAQLQTLNEKWKKLGVPADLDDKDKDKDKDPKLVSDKDKDKDGDKKCAKPCPPGTKQNCVPVKKRKPRIRRKPRRSPRKHSRVATKEKCGDVCKQLKANREAIASNRRRIGKLEDHDKKQDAAIKAVASEHGSLSHRVNSLLEGPRTTVGATPDKK